MEASPVFFHAIHVDMPVDAVYRRLGYRKGITEISPAQNREIEAVLEDARGLIELKGSAVVLAVDKPGLKEIALVSGDVLRSEAVARMLTGCREVLFMGATAGHAVMEEIGLDSREGNLQRAVVLDAAAGEMTDKALDWIVEYMGRALKPKGKEISRRRFSAGYADFALGNQKIMYERLRLHDLGVRLTSSCVLVPEKSVIALAGITVKDHRMH